MPNWPRSFGEPPRDREVASIKLRQVRFTIWVMIMWIICVALTAIFRDMVYVYWGLGLALVLSVLNSIRTRRALSRAGLEPRDLY
jgi:hypothetical protein